MRKYKFHTVDVFTDRPFGGNPLAVFPEASGLSEAQMQALAAEFNLSETAFVLPPASPANTARVRIFNRTNEMAFAGHPNVGTGFVLANLGRDRKGVLLFEETAGLVQVQVDRDRRGIPTGATIAAPQPLSRGLELPTELIADCAGLNVRDVLEHRHRPVVASVGYPFVLAEVSSAALSNARPSIRAFQEAAQRYPQLAERLSLHLYARDGSTVRARMFAPLAGTHEDPATGSANAALAALLLSLDGESTMTFEIHQGSEMGRPSLLTATARRGPDGVRAQIKGGCVSMLEGTVSL